MNGLHINMSGLHTCMRLSDTQLANNFASLRKEAETYLGPKWVEMLDHLRDDRAYETIYLGMMRAPAAKGNHHAFIGGLVAHMLQMWYLGKKLMAVLPVDPLITHERVLRGIIAHDFHKAWATFVEVPASDKAQKGLDYGKHVSNSMMTNDQKSIYLLMQHGIVLDMVDMNVLFSSEGGWAEAPPRWVSTLAKFVYLLDEMSGNVAQRSIQANILDLRQDGLVDVSTFEVNRFVCD